MRRVAWIWLVVAFAAGSLTSSVANSLMSGSYDDYNEGYEDGWWDARAEAGPELSMRTAITGMLVSGFIVLLVLAIVASARRKKQEAEP